MRSSGSNIPELVCRVKGCFPSKKQRLYQKLLIQMPPGALLVMIRFTIDEALPGQNVLLRMHWAKRNRLRNRVAWLVKAALLAPESGYRFGAAPIQRCRVTITRRCRKRLDDDNAMSACKAILDILQPPSKTHPVGLAVIQDDSRACIVEPLVVLQTPGKAGMVVEIEELP